MATSRCSAVLAMMTLVGISLAAQMELTATQSYPQNVVISVNFQVGTPPQQQRVQLDTGSDLLWLSSVDCEPYRSPELNNQQQKCLDIPASMLKNGRQIGYSLKASSTSEVQADFLWREGYGTGKAIYASTVSELNAKYPEASFGTSTDPSSIYFMTVGERSWKTWAAYGKLPAYAHQLYPFALLGGPLVTDVLTSIEGLKLTFQATEAREANNNLGSCQYPVGGIMGMGAVSSVSKRDDINYFTVALKQRTLFLNEEPPSELSTSDPQALLLVEETSWSVALMGFRTSDGKVSSKDLYANVNVPPSSVLLDSGTSGFALPSVIYDALSSTYADLINVETLEVSLPEDAQGIFELNVADGGSFEISVPLGNLLLQAQRTDTFIIGAPAFLKYNIRYDLKNLGVSISEASDVQAVKGFDYADAFASDPACVEQHKEKHATMSASIKAALAKLIQNDDVSVHPSAAPSPGMTPLLIFAVGSLLIAMVGWVLAGRRVQTVPHEEAPMLQMTHA